MTKIIGTLLALTMFCAIPAVAFAQESNDNVASGNTQNGEIDQGAAGGSADGGSAGGGSVDGSGGDASGGDGGVGGDAGNQAAVCQQNAGDDATCTIDQSQSFGGDTFVRGSGGGEVRSGDVDVNRGHGGVVSVRNVRLARTGFDAWVLALIGGVSLAGASGCSWPRAAASSTARRQLEQRRTDGAPRGVPRLGVGASGKAAAAGRSGAPRPSLFRRP